MKLPSLSKLASAFNRLPGISKKQAEKMAYFLASEEDFIKDDLLDALKLVSKNIKFCKECNNSTEDDICYICADKSRRKILIIVESPMDIFKFEETKILRPFYHVLGGLVSVKGAKELKELKIANLLSRAKQFDEIILALSPNLDGIVTSQLLMRHLSDFNVTQLAQGIPLGAAMDYVDDLTLKAAIENRKGVK